MTANALIGREKMFLENGFDGFISKPIDSRELNKILNEFIRNRKPTEVVEAARHEQQEKEHKKAEISAHKAVTDNELAAAAVHDIENALAVLEELLPQINSGNTNLVLFITTVHGIKSAFANIGEKQLSDAALALEQAGHKGETSVITAKTPEFMHALRSFRQKARPLDRGSGAASGEISPDNKVFLRNKLDEVKTSCGKLMIKEAKAALAALKKKPWPPKISDIINEISLYLIRGEYAKAVSAVDKAEEDGVL